MSNDIKQEKMRTRKLGTLEVSALGMGCMNLSSGTGPGVSVEEGIKTIRNAYEQGITFLTRQRLTAHLSMKSW